MRLDGTRGDESKLEERIQKETRQDMTKEEETR